jgi:23S rRNA (uracil1939-C5)-methyltransferase
MSDLAPTLHAPATVTPICPYFGVCGGCASQDVAYRDQLAAKAAWAGELFAPLQPEKVLPIIGSPQEYPTFFRNKIRFSFIKHEGKVWPSRHKKGEEAADIPADHCYLQSDEANKIIQFVANWADMHHWSLYNPYEGGGWLKHVLIRQGKQTGEVMLCVVTDTSPIPELEAFVAAVHHELPFITSLYHTESWGKSVDNLQDTLLWGAHVIHEMIGEYRFAISPQAFFQTNGEMVETLYRTVGLHARQGNALWDLYAGSATIGIFLHNQFKEVLGIESNPSNIADAEQNLELNQVTNVHMVQGNVEDVLTSAFLKSHNPPDCIVVDPPRAGLHQRFRTLLPYIGAPKVVYVSCNPLTCLRDCKELVASGFRLTTLQPIDMFPHSWHCEILAVLEKE